MIMPMLGKGAAILGGAVLLCGAAAYSAGVVCVDVQEKKPGGHHIFLPLPALAGPAALAFIPAHHMHMGRQPEARQLLPVVQLAVEELERCPDGPLVDVESAHETVHVKKDGGYLTIDVDDPQETVHVAVPLRVVSTMAGQIARRAEQQRESDPSI